MVKGAAQSLWVVVGSFVLLLALMAWFFDGVLERRANPNRALIHSAPDQREVILLPDRRGHYVAPGRINGVEVTFLLDTGASHVAIPAHLAERLDLSPGRPVQLLTAAGSVTARQTVIDRIELGGITMHNIGGSLNPAMPGDFILLGMTFLRHLDFRQEGERLILQLRR